MNIFESRFNPMMWFMALVLAAVVAGMPALAAPAPTFSATASGTTSSLTLTANLSIGDEDVGQPGNIYLAAKVGSAWFAHNGADWMQLSGGSLPVYSVGLLVNQSIEVVRNANLSAFGGTQIYVGYGLSESDMVANRKFGLVYTVGAQVVQAVHKPRGAFTSKNTSRAIANTNAKGALIRVFWSDLEPTADGDVVFDKVSDPRTEVFKTSLDALVAARGAAAKYSLAIIAGPHAPDWLKAECAQKVKCENLSITFREGTESVPRAWDSYVQQRLEVLAQKVAAKLKSDARLELVYVPQMSANGLEGHFNGNTKESLERQGMSAEKWTSASVAIAKSFARAFDNKAIAFEVHEVLDSHTIPEAILQALWEAPETKGRVGAAMWWINGQLNYQPKLVEVLKNFPGDKYGQIIGNSSQDCNPNPTCTDNMGEQWSNYGRYGIEAQGGGFASVFAQAKELRMRYIEPWPYEFETWNESGTDPRKQTIAQAIKDFNSWADSSFP